MKITIVKIIAKNRRCIIDNTFTLSINDDDTFENIKEYIQTDYNIPVSSQKLFLGKINFSDDDKVSNFNIPQNKIFFITY